MRPHLSGRLSRLVLPSLTTLILALALGIVVPAVGASAEAPANGPCDIYGAGGAPCVGAFSTTRALYGSYGGPLYQVKRASDGATVDVGAVSPGGPANADQQTSFCSGTSCTVPVIYDQSPNHNDLTPAPAGEQGAANRPAAASALPVTVAGKNAFGLYLPPGVAYRRSSKVTTGMARGAAPESLYMVASGTNVNRACCSDFGNVETEPTDTGAGHMDALNLSTLGATETSGWGPWVQADLEEGVFQGKTTVWAQNRGNSSEFVTATLKNNGVDTFAIKGGDAQRGALSTWYDGSLPDGVDRFGSSWQPMKLEGSIGLGAGGDNSNRGTQFFFEGVITSGYASDATENAVQANVVAQGYHAKGTGGGPGRPIVGPGGKCVGIRDVGGSGDAAVAQLDDCLAMAVDQRWVGSTVGEGTLNTLGKCLDLAGVPGDAGAGVVLHDCDGAAHQQWFPQADGSVQNPGSGLCLESPNGSTANGTALRARPCNGSAAQRFAASTPILHPVPGGKSKCVDVSGDDTDAAGRAVQIYTCQNAATGAPAGLTEAADQQWIYDPADQSLRSNGRCLDVDGNLTDAGTAVESWTCNGVGGQRWVPRPSGALLNPASNLCLDAPGGSTANETVLRIWPCDGTPGQRFILN
ncbi:ricin-type beta-trefoil lectin domain protein [Clavibacter sp. VKM Ac-2873]|uniref:arabinofuranosidase catalytic domain-containing protein n=1 Tax=Clavibacter sp. VKM Ac-2873 TaxID=2783813 RepID=UPI00188A2E38|nr:arabinofuranosidase catalytic domain-containing protein [Clavibacter sp. VKM Ac-2873]MBF4619489.1 ricin-type beta-trefoil lectin domain protein [Clavibacter sp. VKM Ac-2873]